MKSPIRSSNFAALKFGGGASFFFGSNIVPMTEVFTTKAEVLWPNDSVISSGSLTVRSAFFPSLTTLVFAAFASSAVKSSKYL